MTNEFKADLHCHSCYSDGTDTPEELLSLAANIGLSALSVTDHDTIAAYGYLPALAKQKNILLISGVEFSAAYNKEPVHVLGYSYDLKNEAIENLCKKHKQRREERNHRIIAKLRLLGIDFNFEDILFKYHEGSIGRPHIAYALQKKGVVKSIQEAFELYLAEGKPAYDAGEPLSVEETIDTIHFGKGKAILAHPHLLKRSTTIRAVLAMPFDGLECYYARFSLPQEKKWVELAKQKKWLITGGSDYHGSTKPSNLLGSSWTQKEYFDILYNHYLSNLQ